MDEIEERLEFETPQFVHALFANEPKELSYLKEKLGVNVVTREGWILLRGNEDGVKRAKKAIADLEEARRSGSEITAKDFRTAIDVAAEDGKTGVAQLGKVKLLGTNGRKPVVPRTPQQMAYIQSMATNDVVFGLGPAGTGKTYLAMAMALSLLKAKKINRIVLTRPAVEAGEALGFLPGDLQEKVAPYLRPLYDAMYDMLDAETGKRYMEDGTIEIAPLAYMRGRTLANSFVILDEAQNTTPEQLFMLLTRIGEGSQCVVTGDGSQVDLKRGQMSGLLEAEHALKEVESVDFIRFTGSDVVRHPVVARIIAAYDAFRK
jgi:phosphate starvation-inducible PhoH-like protein